MRKVTADYHISLPDGRCCRLYLCFVPPLDLTAAELQDIARALLDMEAASCKH